jgi:hypothetical protein
MSKGNGQLSLEQIEQEYSSIQELYSSVKSGRESKESIKSLSERIMNLNLQKDVRLGKSQKATQAALATLHFDLLEYRDSLSD